MPGQKGIIIVLYALPDHEVMESLLPGIRNKYVPVDQAIQLLQDCPGLVPVAANPADKALLYFADIGSAPFKEWKYIYTIQHLVESGKLDSYFCTDMAILGHNELPGEGLSPDGLIFHVSRCGSTLLTKALGRSPANLTINQGGPLQEGFWAAITDQWRHEPVIDNQNLHMFRNLVLLMSRKRRAEYSRSFTKFISWNVIYLNFIRSAFPEASILYIYRNPVEVIATVLQETTAVLRAKGTPQAQMLTGLSPEHTGRMSNIEYLAHCYACYFDTVLKMSEAGGLHFINYEQLKHPEAFAQVLSHGLNFRPDTPELEQMREQYRFYSKDDSDQTIFTGDPDALLEILSPNDKQLVEKICGEKFVSLNKSRCNLFPST